MTTIYQSRYQGEEERDWRETTPEYIMEEVALGAVPGFEQGLKRDPAIRARQTAALEILDSTGYLLGKRMEFRVFPPPPTPPIEPTPDNPVTFILRVHSERVSSQYDRDHQEEGAWGGPAGR